MNHIRKVGSININAIEVASKKHLLKDFVLDSDFDVVFVQEVHFESFGFLPQYAAYVNISKDGKGTAVLVRKSIEVKDPLLDPSGRIVSLEIGEINFVNIYGHSGSQFRVERDDLFKNKLAIHLNKPSVKGHVIGGDFNCVVDSEDVKGRAYNVCSGLKSLITLFNLKDLDKQLNSYSPRKFTFVRNDSASRIDRFYVSSELITRMTNFETVPVAFSDHHAIKFKYKLTIQEIPVLRGRGYWKINTSFLNDENISRQFKEVYDQLKQRRKYNSNFAEWWNVDFKAKVRQFYKEKSIAFNRNISIRKSILHTKLRHCMDMQMTGEDVSSELGTIKSKIMEIEHNRLEYYASHLEQSSILEEEKMNIYQISKQLKNMVSSTPKVYQVKEVHQHFKGNFADSTRTYRGFESFGALDSITKELNDDNQGELIREITENELEEILRKATKKKSPGPDGINYEFYSVHFDIVKGDLLKLFNGFIQGDFVPNDNFSSGIITLIHKKGDKADLNNFRPISLLNSDYKLLMKILASRFIKIMDHLLDIGQTVGKANESCVDIL